MRLKKIKEEMAQRKITPSADAWDQLNAQLDQKTTHKKSWIYWVSGVAAAILLGYVISPLLTTTSNISPIEKIVSKQAHPKEENNIIVHQPTLKKNKEKQLDQEKKTPLSPAPVSVQATKKRAALPRNAAPIATRSPREVKALLQGKNVPSSNILITKPDETIASLSIEESIKKQPTTSLTAEEEVDLLLQKAFDQQSNKKSIALHQVNPNMLLIETEWEIESDNKHKVKHSIQDGLLYLKSEALAMIGPTSLPKTNQ